MRPPRSKNISPIRALRGTSTISAIWCRQEIARAAALPERLALLELLQAQAALPSIGTQVLYARYQTMLDNQLYKALSALKEAQAGRGDVVEGDIVAA